MGSGEVISAEESPSEVGAPTTELVRHREWNDMFIAEFSKESDRGAVIVAASIFDATLESLLKQYFVASPGAADDLFDGANAPLATFSSKVAMAFRLGLISGKFCRNLHLIRRIRNEFAHNIHGGSFDDTAIKSRVLELYKGQRYNDSNKIRKRFPDGVRGDFLSVCLWMLWALNTRVKNVQPIHEKSLEFGFFQADEHV